MSEEKKSFCATLPGVLTGLATVITAITGLIVVMNQNGDPNRDVDHQPVTTTEAENGSKPQINEPIQQTTKPKIQTVRVRAQGSISHGFFTPKGYVVMMAQALGDSSDVTVNWTSGSTENISQAKVHTRSALAKQVAFLKLSGDKAPKGNVPFRNSTTLQKGEKVVRYLSEHDQAPGTVLEIGVEKDVFGGVVRKALVTTNISGPGDSGAPVVDGKGNIVAMIYGGSQTMTISVPIEEIKASFFDAF